MLRNLEKLIGTDAILRVHMVNEKYNRTSFTIVPKLILYLLIYPIKISLLVMVVCNRLPEYVCSILIITEWYAIASSIFYLKKLNCIYYEWYFTSKKDRLLLYTDYYLLVSFFEKPTLEIIYNLSKYVFLFGIALSGRWTLTLIFVTSWIYVSHLKDLCETYIILYLEKRIEGDLNSYGTT